LRKILEKSPKAARSWRSGSQYFLIGSLISWFGVLQGCGTDPLKDGATGSLLPVERYLIPIHLGTLFTQDRLG
jgi:hypothetical protein